MKSLGVTDAGYKLLEETGLKSKIDKFWCSDENWCSKFLIPVGSSVDVSEVEEILDEEDILPERKKAIEKWMKKSGDSGRMPRDLFMISGAATDYILSRNDIKGFEMLGFSSIAELDGLVAAYFLEKYDDSSALQGSRHIWHSSDGFKTRIYGDDNNYLHIDQVLIDSGCYKPEQIRLDGDETVLFGELETNYLLSDDCYWSVLAAIALKYADTVSIEIPEAINWREFMGSLGWNGDIVNPDSGSVAFRDFASHYENMILAQLPDKTDIKKVKKTFFGMMEPYASRGISYLPAIDTEDRLVFYIDHGISGAVEFSPYGGAKKYYPLLYFTKYDVSELFKGVVNSIMAGQSGTRPEHLAYMFNEWDQIKESKPLEYIKV
ncbi:MAG: hypothetical protein KAJ20_00110 [Candidatus Aenigmarchaeota archaeon]|nr:hypothetical protein [Candidatus Aenigmarchaeota archaeon]MCK5372721.1 hypothetical protein [Candidatus Aenigmarchaeota archaeon]